MDKTNLQLQNLILICCVAYNRLNFQLDFHKIKSYLPSDMDQLQEFQLISCVEHLTICTMQLFPDAIHPSVHRYPNPFESTTIAIKNVLLYVQSGRYL